MTNVLPAPVARGGPGETGMADTGVGDTGVPAATIAGAVAAARGMLRLEGHGEDAVLTGLVRTALETAEIWCGAALVARPCAEVLTGTGGWQTLRQRPVTAITEVTGVGLADHAIDIDAAGRGRVMLVSADDATLVLDAAEPVADGWGGGTLRWFGGANGGLESAVARSAGAVVTLRSPPVFAVAAGVLVEVAEGCDKSLATCATRFGNAANFRGEPHLPGIDLLTRWPGN